MSGRRNGRDDELELADPTAASEEPASEGGLAPSPQPPAAPEAELEELRNQVAELQQALLRRRADFENFRKRVERDRHAAAVEAEASLLRQLLGTVDNLERALAAPEAGPGLREGVGLTYRDLLGLFESLGVEALSPLGERFDPAEHQAILHEPAPGYESGTVAEVLRKGFRYRDRLLRPALVKVASGEEAPAGEGGEIQ